MIVQCIHNKVASVPKNQLQHLNKHMSDDQVFLRIGEKYRVQGIALREGNLWFYVFEDDSLTSLRPNFSGFFKVLDPTFPGGWTYCEHGHSEFGAAFLPKKWAERRGFYERVINEEAGILSILAEIRAEQSA